MTVIGTQTQRKMLPGQKDGEPLDAYLKRTWQDKSIQHEFNGDFETYEAWAKAESMNLIKYLGREKHDK